MRLLWLCRLPCGVIPSASGTQHASDRAAFPFPRSGTPGHGAEATGTVRRGIGLRCGYQPDTAGTHTHCPNPDRYQCGDRPEARGSRVQPVSPMAEAIFSLVAAATRSGWLSAVEAVPCETPAALATSAMLTGVRAPRACPRPQNTYVRPWHA